MLVMITMQAGIELESAEYHQSSETYRYEYDRKRTPVSMAVVAALSDVMDRDPAALEPLHGYVDTDALQALLDVRASTNGDVHVTWTYDEYAVTVHSYGVVTVAPREQTGDRTEDDGHR